MCDRAFSTSESRVCRLTGTVVGTLDDLHYGRISEDGSRIIKHWSTPQRRAKQLATAVSSNVIRTTTLRIFQGAERHKLHQTARTKFFTEVRRQGKNCSPSVHALTKLARTILTGHAKNLRPPARVSDSFLNMMLRAVPKMWMDLHRKRIADCSNRKRIAAFTAVLIECQRTGLTVGKHCVVRKHPFCHKHAPASLQYAQLGVTCRSMSKELRTMKQSLIDANTQQPLPIVFDGSRQCGGVV